MATFVLVHGAFHGGWCWVRVAERLRAAGHTVFTPTLTGLGQSAHLASPEVGLETHIQDILGLLKFERLEEVVLCGHSYGGFVITGVADRAPEKIASLVYIDTVIPKDGQCVFDFYPEQIAQAIIADAQQSGEGWRMSIYPAERFDIVDPADRQWVQDLMTHQPLRACRDRLRLTGEKPFEGKRVYVMAQGYHLQPFVGVLERLRQDPAWEATSLAGGHDLMIDAPDALSDLLIGAADRANRTVDDLAAAPAQ